MNTFTINAYSKEKFNDEIIKVGVYDCKPYYEIDSNGNISGYYDEYLKLLQKKYNFKYEYILYDFDDGLEALEDGKIDVMFGISIKPERIDKILFNKIHTNTEDYELLTKNKTIKVNDLRSLDGLKIGLINGVASSEFMLNLCSAMNINMEPIFEENVRSMEQDLSNGKIDIMICDKYFNDGKYRAVYEFSGEPVYIGVNKNKPYILENIDKVIEDYSNEKNNPIKNLYNEYFFKEYNEILIKERMLIFTLIVLSLLIIIFFIIPNSKRFIIKNEIRTNMKKDRYILQYQPIYNPRNKMIVGFEGLLRLLDGNNNFISPYKFIPQIEKNNMLSEVSFWILGKVISDYNEIKDYECVKGRDFYISLNLSLKEIEDDNFVKESIEILSKSNIGPNKICLEIIERVRINELNKIVKNVKILKKAGFKIAIDDFGIEYSNLDILYKLDTDIIKVDKDFVDGIGKDAIKEEIILFISRLAKIKNKSVVLEGIEEEKQDMNIKKIKNNFLYVQGYFYNKPMLKENIKAI